MNFWVLDGSDYKAAVLIENGFATLSNKLVTRKIKLDSCSTVSLFNHQKGIELIERPFPDFMVSVDNKQYMSDDGFTFESIEETPCIERIPFKRSETMTESFVYPPEGKGVVISYRSKKLKLSVKVRYEIYDSMPVIMKQVTVENENENAVVIDNISADVLKITDNRDTLFVDSDYNSTTDCLGLDFNEYAKNYAHYHYDTLEIAPQQRMNLRLEKSDIAQSIVAYELLFGSDYYENRLIEVRCMYRRIAPWCTDNAMFFHLISDSTKDIKNAVDQCKEIGLEMIIQSFGSGVNMESGCDSYLNRIKRAYDYGHSKGIRMGAYTLAYVKNYRPVNGDEALNHDYSHICRCLACDWAEKYMKNVLRFIDRTGADAIEIDGPYGMMTCSGGKTHHHEDFTDSQYKQWKAAVLEWYKEIKSRGVYINAPDWHFLNGTNRTGVGYEEIAFSERRAEQLVSSRIYYYKGTFSKNPSQGWGFLPLNVYHGGGEKAMFYPTDKNSFEFDWAFAQIVASGVWPTLRGKLVYDTETGKEIMKKWVGIYKRYRKILNGITIHFLPPRINTDKPDRTTCIDAIMNQLPYGDERGFVMFFNQTDEDITQEITLPAYYTGLTSLEAPPAPFENTKNCDIEFPIYGDEIAPLIIKECSGEKRKYIRDKMAEDKDIPELPKAHATKNTLVISESDEKPETYNIDSNGNVKIKITLPAMTYKWYVIREK